jgi:branched-chain amino acid transport system substrate-binding protein
MHTTRLASLPLSIALAVAGFAAANHARAEQGITDNTITLGMSAPFSGPNGAYGVEMREAINTYLRQVNENGGVYGRKLQLVALDDGYESERTVDNTKQLLTRHNAFALMGYYGSSPTAAAMPVFTAAKTPLVGTISGSDALRTPANRYMFNTRASYADETEAIVHYMVSMGLKEIGVFYQNDGFGQSGLAGVSNALRKYGMTPTVTATVERNSLDVDAAVEKFAKARPQAIVMVTLYKPTAAFVREMKKAGAFPVYATLSPVGADLLVAELGSDARGIGISQVMPYPWDSTVPVVKEYQRAIAQPGQVPKYSYYGVEGYITAKVMVEALKKAGRDLTREKLVAALDSMRDYNIGGYKVNYAPADHNGSKLVDLTVIGPGGKMLR